MCIRDRGKSYFDNGKVKETLPYSKGYLQGTAELFNYNGESLISLKFENGVFLGYSYLDSEGQQKEIISIPGGTGVIEAYFPNGKKSVEYNIEAGVIKGEYLRYYSNGQLEAKVSYGEGVVHGLTESYYDTGKRRHQLSYAYGEKHGEHNFYYPNGKLKRAENWMYGEQHGMTTLYDENETITLKIRYRGDVPYDFE